MNAISQIMLVLSMVAGSMDDQRSTNVGAVKKITQLVLPGSELEVKPVEDRKLPVVVRIISVDKHGSAHRYDLSYYSLEAGTFDLRDYLQRKDGTPLIDVPELKVTVNSLLPSGQVLPHELQAVTPPSMGGYRMVMIAAGVIWILGLLAILFVGRRNKTNVAAVVGHRMSLADQLRPLIERGIAGTLDPAERAGLERSLLAFWTKKLKLDDIKPAERFAQLREHVDSGPLLTQLETWLHRPGPQSNVDVASLLRPYQNMPTNVIDAVPEVASA